MSKFKPWPQSKADNFIEYSVSAYEPKGSPGASDASVPRLQLRAGASQSVLLEDAPGVLRNPHRKLLMTMLELVSTKPDLAAVGRGRMVVFDQVFEITARSPGLARIQARYPNSRAVMAELIVEVMPAPSQKSAAEVAR